MLTMIEKDAVQAIKDKDVDIFIHGCNCFHQMKKGIAHTLSTEFPQVYLADKVLTVFADLNKLGSFTSSTVQVNNWQSVVILNAYTQYGFGTNGPNAYMELAKLYTIEPERRFHNAEGKLPHFHYPSFKRILFKLRETLSNSSMKIGMPKIGCGLAGGDWELTLFFIQDILRDQDVTIFYL